MGFFLNREADQLFYEASETTKLKSDFEKGNIAFIVFNISSIT